MSETSRQSVGNVLIGAGVLALTGVAILAVLAYSPLGRNVSGEYRYDPAAVEAIDPALIRWRQVEEIETELNEPRGISIRQNCLYVAGDQQVRLFITTGEKNGNIPSPKLSLRHTAVLLDERRIFVATDKDVYRFVTDPRANGGMLLLLRLDGKAVITSLAVSENGLFIADAGNRVIHHFDLAGRLIRRIGEKASGGPGFTVPGPYFDLLIDDAGLLRVANPGRLRVETFTQDGRYKESLTWGFASGRVEGFAGCCNPTHIAQLPDGRFVTSEKGSPRVKVYTREGTFENVVAGPGAFDAGAAGLDLATDLQGRIYVLDPRRKTVRVFEEMVKSDEFAN
jgi:hypothetical protein